MWMSAIKPEPSNATFVLILIRRIGNHYSRKSFGKNPCMQPGLTRTGRNTPCSGFAGNPLRPHFQPGTGYGPGPIQTRVVFVKSGVLSERVAQKPYCEFG